MSRKIDRCFNIQDIEVLAEKNLPGPIWHYLKGAADDELTMANNTGAFDKIQLVPRVLQDVSAVDMSTTVMGQKVDWPVVLAPTGMSRLFHHEGERAVAKAAEKSGTWYSLSTVSTINIEDVAATSSGPKMFQVYVVSDPALNDELMDRARAAGYKSMCLTVDTVTGGNRERDHRTGMNIPISLTPASVIDFLRHPTWLYHHLRTGKPELANLISSPLLFETKGDALMAYLAGLMQRKLTWADAERMISRWGGTFAIKGILSAADAVRAVEAGASTIIVSNHGGRQLDTTPAPIEVAEEIIEAVDGRAEVIIDGGIRRGTHVIKALAMGAKACMIGRPYLYGLAAGGQAGVERSLELLKSEVERDMTLLGCNKLSDIGPQHLRYLS